MPNNWAELFKSQWKDITPEPVPPPGTQPPVPEPEGIRYILWSKAKGDLKDNHRFHQMVRERQLADAGGVAETMAQSANKRLEKGQEPWLIFQNYGRTRTDDLLRLRPGWPDEEEVWMADWKWARHQDEDIQEHAKKFWLDWTNEWIRSYTAFRGPAVSGWPMDVELAPPSWREPWMRYSLYQPLAKHFSTDCWISNWKGGYTAWGDVLYGSDVEEEMGKITYTRQRHPRSWYHPDTPLRENPWIRLPTCWRTREQNRQTIGQSADLVAALYAAGIKTISVWWDGTANTAVGCDALIEIARGLEGVKD